MKEYIDSDCKFAVRGLTEAGQEVFYTGRAGEFAWVSNNKRDAFLYYAKEVAERKALLFNRSTELHGLRFIAVSV